MLQTAIEAVAPGGIVVQVGMGKDRANFPVLDVVFKELDFRGCFRYTNTVRESLRNASKPSDASYQVQQTSKVIVLLGVGRMAVSAACVNAEFQELKSTFVWLYCNKAASTAFALSWA